MYLSFEQEVRLCRAFLLAKGLDDTDAGILADSVAYSDFTGIYSHGLSRFANYLQRFANGAYAANAKLTPVSDTGSTAVFDCGNGCGVIAVSHVYEKMRERARQHGIVIAAGRRASNIGCGAYFGRKAAADELIMLLCCNTTRCVAPFGGADSVLGTNPIIVSAPAGEERPLLLDISTTNVAFGKVQAYAREGRELPPGWALDADGKPTTNAKEARTVLPIAGPKGYGLAVMIEMFAALLPGAGYGSAVGFASKGQYENTGFSMILIDPSKFMPVELFKHSIDEYIRSVKSGRRAENVKELLLPGELEMRRQEELLQTGYEVSGALESELLAYAVEFGIAEAGMDLADLVSSL